MLLRISRALGEAYSQACARDFRLAPVCAAYSIDPAIEPKFRSRQRLDLASVAIRTNLNPVVQVRKRAEVVGRRQTHIRQGAVLFGISHPPSKFFGIDPSGCYEARLGPGTPMAPYQLCVMVNVPFSVPEGVGTDEPVAV